MSLEGKIHFLITSQQLSTALWWIQRFNLRKESRRMNLFAFQHKRRPCAVRNRRGELWDQQLSIMLLFWWLGAFPDAVTRFEPISGAEYEDIQNNWRENRVREWSETNVNVAPILAIACRAVKGESNTGWHKRFSEMAMALTRVARSLIMPIMIASSCFHYY